MKRRAFVLAAVAMAIPRGFAKEAARTALAGDSFMYGASEARLADIIAPRIRTISGRAEPFAEEAQAVLGALLREENAIVDAMPADRWGRRIVRVTEGGGAFIGETLLRRGAARVYPETNNHDVLRRFLACEAEARQALRGLWRLRNYRVREASNAQDAIGGYHLVEGVVVHAEKHGPRVYLNFGEDYRSDFTASARSALARRWRNDGVIDLENLAGAHLRIRGYVAYINGPSIDLTHPLQIEQL